MKIACRLCGSTENKRGRSHIAPAAFFREIKRRGGGLMLISRNGAHRIKPSKDGPKDHKILCLKCETSTSPIDDYGVKAFMGREIRLYRIYSKKQLFAGHSDTLDGKRMKLFFLFTFLKAAWSDSDLYAKFSMPECAEKLFVDCVLSGRIDERVIQCLILHRQPTVRGVPGSPEVHNGSVYGAKHGFGPDANLPFQYHILEYTALVAVRDVPAEQSLSELFVPDSGRIWILRSHGINEKLDQVAIEFMRDRLRTENPPSVV